MRMRSVLCIAVLLAGCSREEERLLPGRRDAGVRRPRGTSEKIGRDESAVVRTVTDNFNREGTGEKRSFKDSLENKPPPGLQVAGWMNTGGGQLKLEELRGKVVAVEFWGVW